ncbi:MAG: hypothetical protein U0U25_01345 [Flavobacteriales bacterium]
MCGRIVFLCAWLLSVGGTAHAQTLQQAEYFWDTDPGAGLATPMSASDGNLSAAFEQVSANTIVAAGGLHVLNIRMKGADGTWGPVFRTVVDVVTKRTVQLTMAEYFWDTEPGPGNGIAMLALDGNFSSAFEQASASATPPPAGLHTLSLRVKGDDGTWGPVFRTIVDVVGTRQVKLTIAEYFWDQDPGAGNGTLLMAVDGNYSNAFEQLSASAGTSGLYVGPHVLNIRAKGLNNVWGPVFRTVVQVDPQPPVTFTFDLRVALQGCMGSTLMNNTLRNSGLVPLVEPYTGLGYDLGPEAGASTTSGVLGVTFPPGASVVDWILVEFRPTLAPWQVTTRIPLLVRRGGTVSLADGTYPFQLALPAGSYHVVVRHRNHLPVSAATPVTLSTNGQTVAMDLTSAAAQAYGSEAQVLVGSLYCMWAGDVNGDGSIKYTGSGNDRDPILVSVGSATPNNLVNNVYSTRDVNMNGQVNYTGSGNDRDPILVNVGSTTPNNVRNAHLP